MIMGKVFYHDGAADSSVIGCPATGWYYQIDLADPVGPFDSQLEAGRAARAAIAQTAEEKGLTEEAVLTADPNWTAPLRYTARTDIPKVLGRPWPLFAAYIHDANHPDGIEGGASCCWCQAERDAVRIAAALNRDNAVTIEVHPDLAPKPTSEGYTVDRLGNSATLLYLGKAVADFRDGWTDLADDIAQYLNDTTP